MDTDDAQDKAVVAGGEQTSREDQVGTGGGDGHDEESPTAIDPPSEPNVATSPRPALRIETAEILNRTNEIHTTHAPDSPTTMLITTLRDELLTLNDQSSVLNAKLIASLDRVATLEDTVYQHAASEKQKDQQIEQLERAKAQWEESMNTGLLVERKVVKDEMQRLVEGLVEEERRRGSAEEGRARVEREVDDLSATLFEQANTMVAAERMARAQADQRLRQAEENLQAAEAAMRDMQHHLQSLPALLPPADLSARPISRTYNTLHIPYAEFTAFVQHLRVHRPRKPDHLALFPPPTLAALLTQPFLARAQTEDVDPSLRLDSAPGLSWLTRRSVTQAILAGELIIEPVSMNTLRSGKEYAAVHPADIGCSMCGKPVLKPREQNGQDLPPPPKLATATRNNSTSRFSLKPFFSSPSASPSPSSSPIPSGRRTTPPPTTLFIFRITAVDNADATRMYPLCASGWCLARLRAVCEWWRFVRVSMVDVIWRGDEGGTSKRGSVASAPPTPVYESPDDRTPTEAEVPDLPARKKSAGWSLGFKTLGGGKGLGLASKPASPTAVDRAEGPETEVQLAESQEVEQSQEIEQITPLGEPTDAPLRSDDPQPADQPISSSASAASASETSERANAFSTPQTSSAPLSPEQVHRPSETEGNSIDLSSPRGSIDVPASEEPPAPAPAPPTPTRPARRAVSATAPSIPERRRPVSLTLDPSTQPSAAEAPITPDPSAGEVVTPVPVRPPAVPERRLKRVSVAGEEAAESWESKTWKEVVRLKEEMCKARVGVSDRDE